LDFTDVDEAALLGGFSVESLTELVAVGDGVAREGLRVELWGERSGSRLSDLLLLAADGSRILG